MSDTQPSTLLAVSAIDGRYQSKTHALAPYLSEYGLIKHRIEVECEWLLALARENDIPECPEISASAQAYVTSIYQDFSVSDAMQVKQTEATTNHDVKAVEYFVKSKLAEHAELAPLTEWIHFCCTSEDINNTAYALMLKRSIQRVLLPAMSDLIAQIQALSSAQANQPMLSRTHGQTASPTTLGKELRNVVARLERQTKQLTNAEYLGKFNGAVGNFNAHRSAYPQADWQAISARFIETLDLTMNPFTTQIEPHDYLAEVFNVLSRFNQILLDFDRDMWSYISIDYFLQRKVEGETGSSTMPHKINPIDFENSEGNLGVANALLNHMAEKLPVSRWQRDLSDSTVLRNIGSALAHCIIAYLATGRGLSRLEVNTEQLDADLAESWEVLGEAVQTVMRKHGMSEPYEKLKAATRGRKITKEIYAEILESLALPAEAHAELAALTPDSYIGDAATLAKYPSE